MGFSLFGIFIPYYGFFILVGIVCAYFFGLIVTKKRHFDVNDYIIVCAYLVGFGFIGAKILYILVSIKNIDFSLIFRDLKTFDSFMTSGFVFYGGLLGGLLAFVFLKKRHKINSSEYIKVITPALAIAHCFGRIGCSFAGCCYGKSTTSFFAFIYKESIVAPNNVPLVPIQGIEAFSLFILSLLFLWIAIKKPKVKIHYFYIGFYSVLRFFLEFYRGDIERGYYKGLSTSQIISLVLFILVCIKFIFEIINKQKKSKISITS